MHRHFQPLLLQLDGTEGDVEDLRRRTQELLHPSGAPENAIFKTKEDLQWKGKPKAIEVT